jgi:hypothetical protein
MPSPRVTMSPGFVCDGGSRLRSACAGLPFFKEHEGKRYCVLHYPGKDKSAVFSEALKKKLEVEDFNFRGVWFPDAIDFSKITFTKYAYFPAVTFNAEVNFSGATFSADADFNSARFHADANFHAAMFGADAVFQFATFRARAYFRAATFRATAYFHSVAFDALAIFHFATFGARADFSSAKFSGETGDFFSATFNATANFSFANFSAKANFPAATFSADAKFTDVTFNAETSFSSATFKDYVRFEGDEKKHVFGDNSSFNLALARIEKPDRLSFHTLALRPHWFVNIDARKFEFINVNWDWHVINTKQEIKSLEGNVFSAHRLLAIACRNLAVNAEENHRYEEASRFRYMAMEAWRLERWRGFAPWRLSWWYWLASGYGERVWRAFVVLVGVWLLAAALYTQVGFVRWEPRVSSEQEAWEAKRDVVGEPLRWQRALTYSLGVMTLQKPEPRPATNAAQALVMLETILGPVQAALLALAIRRKFMR